MGEREEAIAAIQAQQVDLVGKQELLKKKLREELLKGGAERLQELLEQNAYGGGLNKQETEEAAVLIEGLPTGEGDCWVCDTTGAVKRKVISGLEICPGHAMYALITRK